MKDGTSFMLYETKMTRTYAKLSIVKFDNLENLDKSLLLSACQSRVMENTECE